MSKKVILVAGGTGLVGKPLVALLEAEGNEVRVLFRQETNVAKSIYHWNPSKQEIDEKALNSITHIINLAGVGIADKKWTDARKKEIIVSRVEPTVFLYSQKNKLPLLQQYISASGINCYGYDNYSKKHIESDPFGNDFLSEVVEKWEKAADVFSDVCKVAKLRISVVLTAEGGALPKIAKPIKFYAGTALGTGKQWMPWISLHDLIRMFSHTINNDLEGAFNAVAGNPTNKQFTKQLATVLKKPLWLPNAPSFVLKAMFGEMSSVVLEGLQADNNKIKVTDFKFEDDTLEKAFQRIYK